MNPLLKARVFSHANQTVVSDLKRGVAIGIDAGGTKTVGILIDADGREIARAEAGGANPWDVCPQAARSALIKVLEPLLAGGNARAKSIIETEGAALAECAKRVGCTIRQESALPALLVGSVFSTFTDIREKVKSGLRATGPVVVLESSECVLGAARIAGELAAFNEGRSTEKSPS